MIAESKFAEVFVDAKCAQSNLELSKLELFDCAQILPSIAVVTIINSGWYRAMLTRSLL